MWLGDSTVFENALTVPMANGWGKNLSKDDQIPYFANWDLFFMKQGWCELLWTLTKWRDMLFPYKKGKEQQKIPSLAPCWRSWRHCRCPYWNRVAASAAVLQLGLWLPELRSVTLHEIWKEVKLFHQFWTPETCRLNFRDTLLQQSQNTFESGHHIWHALWLQGCLLAILGSQ